MGKKVDIEIGKNGQMKVEFSGFIGEDCFSEAEVLQGMLREMGLWAIPVTVIPKTRAQLDAEVSAPAESKKKVLLS
jgi:hypothetical protein